SGCYSTRGSSCSIINHHKVTKSTKDSKKFMRCRVTKRMNRFVSFFVTFVPWWLSFISEAKSAEPTYWQDVRPILRKHCTACHSKRTVDEVDVSGGIALDTYEAVVKPAKKPIIHA